MHGGEQAAVAVQAKHLCFLVFVALEHHKVEAGHTLGGCVDSCSICVCRDTAGTTV